MSKKEEIIEEALKARMVERSESFAAEMEELERKRRLQEEKMSKHLPQKQFDTWIKNKHSPWARTVASIPFGEYKTPDISLDSISAVFDEAITGRENERGELMRKAASFIVNGRFRRPLLFVGPPGEGKSCFAKCLAAALGYPIRYINVPSLNSPIALCGTERHYDNSRMGMLVQAVIEEETLSMVFVFDEVDKAVTSSNDGSVEAALLALFDPMWSGMFIDRSLEVPVDLSRCVFICTANELSSISDPLIDRMDVIRFAPYTAEQALEIIRNKTIPKVISSSGMKGRIRFSPQVAQAIVDGIDNGSMRDYEKIVEKLVDNAIYVLLSKNRKRYTVTVDDLDIIWPCEKTKPVGFVV